MLLAADPLRGRHGRLGQANPQGGPPWTCLGALAVRRGIRRSWQHQPVMEVDSEGCCEAWAYDAPKRSTPASAASPSGAASLRFLSQALPHPAGVPTDCGDTNSKPPKSPASLFAVRHGPVFSVLNLVQGSEEYAYGPCLCSLSPQEIIPVVVVRLPVSLHGAGVEYTSSSHELLGLEPDGPERPGQQGAGRRAARLPHVENPAQLGRVGRHRVRPEKVCDIVIVSRVVRPASSARGRTPAPPPPAPSRRPPPSRMPWSGTTPASPPAAVSAT